MVSIDQFKHAINAQNILKLSDSAQTLVFMILKSSLLSKGRVLVYIAHVLPDENDSYIIISKVSRLQIEKFDQGISRLIYVNYKIIHCAEHLK